MKIEPSLVKEILDEALPDECFMVGPAVINRLVDGHINIHHVDKASNLDTSTVVELITASIGLIGAIMQLYPAFRDSRQKSPSDAELLAELKKRKLIPEELTEDQTVEVVQVCNQKLNTTPSQIAD